MITKLLNKKDELVAAFRSSAVVGTIVNKSRAFMILLASVLACPAAMTVFAEPSTVTTSIFSTILGIIGQIFLYIGLVLLIWAVAQLVLAFKNEDADSKSRAITLIVVSIVLIAMPTLIDTIAGATGVNITACKEINGL